MKFIYTIFLIYISTLAAIENEKSDDDREGRENFVANLGNFLGTDSVKTASRFGGKPGRVH